MPGGASKPVIFLAFANDRDDAVRYLRNLPTEARQLRETVRQAEQAGLCEVVERANCTAQEVFAVFQDAQYRHRIAIFHFGGHANGYELLLESETGQGAGGWSGCVPGTAARSATGLFEWLLDTQANPGLTGRKRIGRHFDEPSDR